MSNTKLTLAVVLLGPDHPDVAMTLNNLAVLCKARSTGTPPAFSPLFRSVERLTKERILTMRHNRRVIILYTILMLLVSASFPIARSALAVNLGPFDQTVLDVRQPGAQPQWGGSRTIHSLHIVHFRWQTTAPNTIFGAWQIFDYKPQPMGMNETPFATAKVILPPPGQFQEFPIDFVQLQQQNPTRIPANAPANGKDYYLRMVPFLADGVTPSGQISDTVKITYVKSPPPSPNPPKIEYVFAWPGGHYVDLNYFATKPVVPLVTVSRSAPSKDAKGNPKFKKNQIVSSAFPFLAGYDAESTVEVKNLTPKTHFHYIIMAKDEKGGKTYKTGEFTTETRFVTVSFDKIFMIDDSDGFPSGAGDMNFAFFVNDINVVGNKKTIPPKDPMDFPTGSTQVFDNIFSTIKDPPNTVKARVNGYDDDDCGNPFFHPLCICLSPGDVTNPHMKNSTCKDGSGENAAATTTINVPDVTDRSQFGIEFLEKSFTMTADNGHLKFRVSGRFDVRFH